MSEELFAVDVDGHVCEPPDLWQKYLEPQYRARAVRIEKTSQGLEGLFIDDQPCIEVLRGLMAVFSCVGHSFDDILQRGGYLQPEVSHPGAYDPQARLRIMDEQRLKTAFIYPTLGLFWPCEVRDFALAAACARAYNHWVDDFCQTDQARLKPIAQIHLGDVQEAVREVRRVAKRGFSGVFVGPKVYQTEHPFLGDPVYDPFWAEVQECNMSVGIHVMFPQEDFTWAGTGYPQTGLPSFGWYALVEVAKPVQTAFTGLMTCGVFNKFPRLKVLLVESTAGWIANCLERLDSKHKVIGRLERGSTLLPSELFARNCWITMDADEKTVRDIAPRVGAEKFLFASDFPHIDACLHPVEEAEEALSGLPAEAVRKILAGNALDIYGR